MARTTRRHSRRRLPLRVATWHHLAPTITAGRRGWCCGRDPRWLCGPDAQWQWQWWLSGGGGRGGCAYHGCNRGGFIPCACRSRTTTATQRQTRHRAPHSRRPHPAARRPAPQFPHCPRPRLQLPHPLPAVLLPLPLRLQALAQRLSPLRRLHHRRRRLPAEPLVLALARRPHDPLPLLPRAQNQLTRRHQPLSPPCVPAPARKQAIHRLVWPGCRAQPPLPQPLHPSPPASPLLLLLRELAMATLRRMHPRCQPLRHSPLPHRPQARMIVQALAPAPARAASQASPTDPPRSPCATPREPDAPPRAAALQPHAPAYPTAPPRHPTRACATATPHPRRPPPAHTHTHNHTHGCTQRQPHAPPPTPPPHSPAGRRAPPAAAPTRPPRPRPSAGSRGPPPRRPRTRAATPDPTDAAHAP
jgi:hypothetical protein